MTASFSNPIFAFKPGKIVGAALLILSNLIPWTAGAQEATSIDDEVIVTATKREEPLQRVPASISALDADDLVTRQITSIESLTHNVPNVAYSNVSAVFPNLSIRGVSADGGSPVMEGTVALHVDGVYQPRVNLLELAMADLHDAEILRGPQGTLYGRNANAGVVNLTTKRPSEDFEASLALTAGNHEHQAARGHVSGPITPDLSIRISGFLDESEGFGRNLYTDTSVNGHENNGGRVSLRWVPRDDVTVDLIGSHSHARRQQPFYIANPYGAHAGSNYSRLISSGADGRLSLKPFEVYNNFDPEQSASQNVGSAIVEWEIDRGFTLKSITSYQDFRFDSIQDHDGTPTEWIVTAARADSSTLSQEFNALMTIAGASLIAGLYYLDDDVDGGIYIEIPPGNPFGAGTTPDLLTTVAISQRTVTSAVFADITYPVSDRFRVLAGVRQNRDRRETIQRIESAINASFTNRGTPIVGCGLDHAVPDLEFDSTTGKLGAQFDVAPRVQAYLTWQSGFKSGAYSSTICDNQYLPERVNSWEAGVKGRYFDDVLTLNLSVFRYDYSNMQLARTYNPTPTTISQIVDNAASARLWGGELEATANLGKGWRADLAVGHVDSEYGPLEARNGAVPGNPNVVLTGNRLPRAPEWTLNAGLEYSASVGRFGDLRIRAQYNYTSDIFFTPFNEQIAYQGDYGLLDAMVTFEPGKGNFLLRLFGRNLTDEAYFNGLFTSALSNNGRGSYGPPRTVGLEIAVDF